jgi:hypothetical protein
MKTFLIQRNVPDAGEFSAAERNVLAQRSCAVLEEMGSEHIQWLHSYINSNNLWCIYRAKNEELVREHARRGDFPAKFIHGVSAIISPTLQN